MKQGEVLPESGFRRKETTLRSSPLLSAAARTGTGTARDGFITRLVRPHVRLVCRMGIAMLSTTEALEGKGQWHKQGKFHAIPP